MQKVEGSSPFIRLRGGARELHVAEMIALDRPRPLEAGERALLDAMVASVPDEALRRQAASAEVVSVCSCGCPSVGLRTAGPPLDGAAMRRLSEFDRDDVLALTRVGVNAEGCEVDVVLHVVSGLVAELEVWAGSWGGDPTTDLPAVESLQERPAP